MSKRYTLTNCTVLTVDQQDHFYADGRIVVEDNTIKAIGDAAQIPCEGDAIDMKGRLVMPGLINTHTHSYSCILRNAADDLRLMEWLHDCIWPMERRLNAGRSYAATRMSALEYLQGGTTTYVDMFYYPMETAKAASASGLRCFLASAFFSDSAEKTSLPEAAEEFIQEYIGRERETNVYPCIGPHAPYSVKAEDWKRACEISDRYGVMLSTHVSETMDENNSIRQQTGMSPTKWLDRMGVFDRRTILAHCVHMDEEDLDILRRHNAAVSYNPVSNLKLASGIMPLKKMQEMGILVTLGTDGAQSNNSMDMLRDIRTGVILQKVNEMDAAFANAREAVRMITINGAKAVGMEDRIGSLEKGKWADIIALDTTSPRLVPLHRKSLKNLYATIAYSACGADVTDSIVNGVFLMKDRKVLSMDADEVRAELQEAAAYVTEGNI